MGGWADGRILIFGILGCGAPAKAPTHVTVRDAYVFEAAAGGTAAGYAVIVNGTDGPDVLDSVTASVARTVTAHDTRQVNGLVTMVPMERPEIAAHDSLVFTPGRAHLMLEGLTGNLEDGERLVLTFWFYRDGPMPVDAIVRPYGS